MVSPTGRFVFPRNTGNVATDFLRQTTLTDGMCVFAGWWHGCRMQTCLALDSSTATHPRIHHHVFTTILAADFQCNPGWNPFFPFSPPSIAKAFQEILPQHLEPSIPTSSPPTLISEQGYSGALDHILTTSLTPPVKVNLQMSLSHQIPCPSWWNALVSSARQSHRPSQPRADI